MQKNLTYRKASGDDPLRLMVDSIPQLAWMTDETGYIFWYNQRWYEYTGTTLEDMEGWKWQDVHHPDHVARVVEKFQEFLEKKEAWEDTFPLRRHDGEYRWFLSRARPIFDENGNVTNWFGTNTDITEQRELENSLQEAVEELQLADQKKNEFLSVLGHELRNPLAAINGSIEILKRQQICPEPLVQVIQGGCQHMSKLLDDLLDLNRISSNKIDLDIQETDFSDLLHQAANAFSKVLSQKNQQLVSIIAPNLRIQGDTVRLEQITYNLLNNAYKYSPVDTRVTLELKEEDDQIVLSVSDEGVGLESHYLDKIFEPFYQIKQDSQAFSGLGIGLALTKKLVEMQDGTITVQSEGLGKGTTFKVAFPVSQYARQNIAAPQATDALIQLGMNVLMIDDNPDILTTMPMLIEMLGCKVQTADTGYKGLDLVKTHAPDAVIVDIGLPDISGHDVAQTLRQNGYAGLLVAMSGYSHKDMKEKSLQVGFDYHLAKPATLEEISATLLTFKSQRL